MGSGESKPEVEITELDREETKRAEEARRAEEFSKEQEQMDESTRQHRSKTLELRKKIDLAEAGRNLRDSADKERDERIAEYGDALDALQTKHAEENTTQKAHEMFDKVFYSKEFKTDYNFNRSEERRVGKECRSRWSPDH